MLEPDYTALTDIALDWERESNNPEAPELADTSTPRQQSSTEDLISPVATVDLSILDSWEEEPLLENDIISPLTLIYPGIKRPSSVPESPLEYRTIWSPAMPRPLKISETRKSISPLSPLSENDKDPDPDAWEDDVPGALDIINSWDDDVPASLKHTTSATLRAFDLAPITRAGFCRFDLGYILLVLDLTVGFAWDSDRETIRGAGLETFRGASDGSCLLSWELRDWLVGLIRNAKGVEGLSIPGCLGLSSV
ncbi:hypothetical protein P7C71_g6186, partial [Lecanoromycetidae sp. Uapishka_2]